MKNACEEIRLSAALYSAEALKLAAYVFSGRADISVNGAGGWLTARTPAGPGAAALLSDFANEALNQQCRLDLASRNSKLVNIIVTKALLSASGAASKEGK